MCLEKKSSSEVPVYIREKAFVLLVGQGQVLGL